MEIVGVPLDADLHSVRLALGAVTTVAGQRASDDEWHCGPLLLVGDGQRAVDALDHAGFAATVVRPPKPTSAAAVQWWKLWRVALDADTYDALRARHHHEVASVGAIVRVPPGAASTEQAWGVLADAGVDVRCQYQCHRPTGVEGHFLVPDEDAARAAFAAAGIAAVPGDYHRPSPGEGITWWGQWAPALAYAGTVTRPILLSFASPRVEQVPGIW